MLKVSLDRSGDGRDILWQFGSRGHPVGSVVYRTVLVTHGAQISVRATQDS